MVKLRSIVRIRIGLMNEEGSIVVVKEKIINIGIFCDCINDYC